jgi:hypothetical protein
MSRAIPFVAAAVALAASGCTTSHCDPAVVNVYWETFTDAAGHPFNCSDLGSGVGGVQVFVNGQAQFLDPSGRASQPIPCVPFSNGTEGVGLVDFAPGTYTIDVQGYDTNGQVRWEDQQTLVIPGNTCGQTYTVDTNPTAIDGDLNVAYSFTGNCRTPTAASSFPTTFIWYELLDQNGQLASAANRSLNSQAIPCSNGSRTFTIPALPFGTYTVSGVQEVELLTDGTFIVYRFNCVPVGPFSHLVSGDVVTVPPLADQQVGGTITCF